MDGDADREDAAGADHLSQRESAAADVEHRDRVAAGVDGEQQALVAVVDQRALRRQVVDHGADERAALAAGRIDPHRAQRSARRAIVGDDRVRGRVVTLHEHRSVALVKVEVADRRCGGCRARTDRDRRGRDRDGSSDSPVGVHRASWVGLMLAALQSALGGARYTRPWRGGVACAAMPSMEDPPLRELAEDGIGDEAAYELISNELLLDGSARLNLATFVTTWMPQPRGPADGRDRREEHDRQGRVPADGGDRGALRGHHRRPLARPGSDQATGCSTTGSSEAVMLGGLALKWRWRERMRAAGRPTDRPNLVAGVNVQVCWEKFCRYWDVEPRLVPMEGDALPPRRGRGRCAVRREHDRRRGDPRLDLRRQL